MLSKVTYAGNVAVWILTIWPSRSLYDGSFKDWVVLYGIVKLVEERGEVNIGGWFLIVIEW